jgi:hypothetical protein
MSMNNRTLTSAAGGFAALIIATSAAAGEIAPRIAWYGTLESGLAAAQDKQRPILLITGAPHCHGVPGIW